MASTTPAITAVLSTTELTQAVLENLDSPFDLIRAIRVCKKFKAVIASSTIAQRRLFMEADWTDTEYIGWRLRSKGKASRRYAPFVIPNSKKQLNEDLQPIFMVSPLILRTHTPLFNFRESSTAIMTVDMAVLLRWAEKDSPWLQMFVTQPPSSILSPKYGSVARGLDLLENDGPPIRRADGVRWVDILESLRDLSDIVADIKRGANPGLAAPDAESARLTGARPSAPGDQWCHR